MGTTGQMLITAGAVLSAGILLLTTYNRVYRWTLRQKAQDRELSAIRKENTLLTYGVLACLKGLEEQGCDGPVHEAIDKIERDLNLRAHDQEESADETTGMEEVVARGRRPGHQNHGADRRGDHWGGGCFV